MSRQLRLVETCRAKVQHASPCADAQAKSRCAGCDPSYLVCFVCCLVCLVSLELLLHQSRLVATSLHQDKPNLRSDALVRVLVDRVGELCRPVEAFLELLHLSRQHVETVATCRDSRDKMKQSRHVETVETRCSMSRQDEACRDSRDKMKHHLAAEPQVVSVAVCQKALARRLG